MKCIVFLVCFAVVGAFNPYSEFQVTQRVTEDMLKKCTNDGNQEAANRAKAAMKEMVTCSQAVAKEIQTSGDNRKGCNAMQLITSNCTKTFFEEIYPCLIEKDIQAYKLTQAMQNDVIEYMCGPELRVDEIKAISEQEKQCVARKRLELANCYYPLRFHAEWEGLTLPRALLTAKGCRMYKEAVACAGNIFSACNENKNKVQVIQGAMESTLNSLGECPERDPSEPNGASALQTGTLMVLVIAVANSVSAR